MENVALLQKYRASKHILGWLIAHFSGLNLFRNHWFSKYLLRKRESNIKYSLYPVKQNFAFVLYFMKSIFLMNFL